MTSQLALDLRPPPAKPTFYLGTHMVNWLARLDVPLFVSRRRLFKMKKLPRARGRWALDSGAYTELLRYRGWSFEAKQYASEVRRFRDEIGGMQWAAPMDWCCEQNPLGKDNVVDIIEHTRLSVAIHQRFTVANFCELKAIAPDVPWIPVLQGWTPEEYRECWQLYERNGVDLRAEPVVGMGTTCRRQSTTRIGLLFKELADEGLKLHGFGVKIAGLDSLGGRALASADSLAWSYDAREDAKRGIRMPGCTHGSCANCPAYALAWREKVLARLDAAA